MTSFFSQIKKHVSDYFHLPFTRAPKRDFAILSQETDYENIPGNQIWTKDRRIRGGMLAAWHWFNLEGDTSRTCFKSPLCLSLGTELSVPCRSLPRARLPPFWSLAQSYFWQFSPYDLNSSFWFHARRALTSRKVIHTDPRETLSHISHPSNLRSTYYYYFSSLELLSQSSDTRTPNGEHFSLKRFTFICIFLTKLRAHHLFPNSSIN